MIRRAENKDINRILDLLKSIAKLHHDLRPDLFKERASKYTYDDLEKILEDTNKQVFVYTIDDYVCAYLFSFFFDYKYHPLFKDFKTLYIDDLSVDDKYKGQGIGKKLMNHALSFAKEEGCYNVELNVWEINDRAVNFYKKLGFEEKIHRMEFLL